MKPLCPLEPGAHQWVVGVCFLAFSLCHCDFTFKILGLTCLYCGVCLVVRVTGDAETRPEPGDRCVNQRGGEGQGRPVSASCRG